MWKAKRWKLYCGFQISWRGGFFRYFFSIALIFLCPACSKSTTSTTQRIRSVLTALESHRLVLSPNIEFFHNFEDNIFTIIPPCLVSTSRALGFFDLRLCLMRSGEGILTRNIEFLRYRRIGRFFSCIGWVRSTRTFLADEHAGEGRFRVL